MQYYNHFIEWKTQSTKSKKLKLNLTKQKPRYSNWELFRQPYPMKLNQIRLHSVVLLLQNSSGASPLATTPTRYKQAWWLGSATDNNAGTIVYNKDADTAKILGGMAPDGYADQSWYRMVEGAQTFLLDAKTLPANWVFGADAAAAVAAAAIWLLRLLLTWLLLL